MADPALIAVVDDDEDVRAALDGLLGSLGYRATLFDSADSFLSERLARRFDCIISDIQMPGTSGLQLAEKVAMEDTPVILITAFPTTEVMQRAASAGVRRVLIKPFDSGDLIDQLDTLLAHKTT